MQLCNSSLSRNVVLIKCMRDADHEQARCKTKPTSLRRICWICLSEGVMESLRTEENLLTDARLILPL